MSGGFSTETLTGADTVRAERSRILSDLLHHVDDLAATALAAMRAEIPAYRDRDAGFLADARDQIARHYRTKLAVLLEERTVTLDDIAFTRRAAMRRARAGLALADYINAFRVGQQVFWEAVVERAGRTFAGHEAALTLAAPLMRYCDFASTQAANAYMEFQQYAAAEAVRESRDLLETLLDGEAPTRGPQLAAAGAHGLTPGTRTPLVVVVAVLVGPADRTAVATGPDQGADARHAACAAIARTGVNGLRTLSVVRRSEIVAVPALGPGGDAGRLCDRLQAVREGLLGEGIALAMGISTVACGIGQVPQAYREARAALEFLPEDGGVAALPRLTPFQYLAMRADDTARHLVDPRIAALLAEDRERGGVLTATIRAFAAADLNLRASAERLQIHHNTAQYRLRRIQERTGRNLRHITDLVELLVAIALQDSRPRATNPGRKRLVSATNEDGRSADVPSGA
ncbi:PucR C-terminal helix-turn-helix domain-containing protein [Thermomonospora echinospora]|uniref:PucR C-terminal helix-turn-helix domain-containing protein n=1 Tax=Thermomonospora echinospora TaxID=1992 RepID=A0A1H5ZWQ0_9ACTN|nr:helix-turn-helix domain-containing protein [Thermomonospora echinospora]SEG40590.1 PucR C-terminal helix-turn-helix domain-containing protein [Thermomonospora echinospora]